MEHIRVNARLDFMSLMAGALISKVLRDSYCCLIELITAALFTMNRVTFPRHCICIRFMDKFTYRYANPSYCDYIM